MKEYIVPIEDSAKDYYEFFVGYIRKHSAEVVRCKDCVYYEELNNNENYCDAIYRDLCGDDEGVCFEPPQDHFCAYGKRRETNGSD